MKTTQSKLEELLSAAETLEFEIRRLYTNKRADAGQEVAEKFQDEVTWKLEYLIRDLIIALADAINKESMPF